MCIRDRSIGQLARVDFLQGDRPFLGAGHTFFGYKQNVSRLEQGLAVLLGYIANVVLIGNQVRGNGQAKVLDAVYLDDSLFALIGLQIRFHFHSSLSATPFPKPEDRRPASGSADGGRFARHAGRSC